MTPPAIRAPAPPRPAIRSIFKMADAPAQLAGGEVQAATMADGCDQLDGVEIAALLRKDFPASGRYLDAEPKTVWDSAPAWIAEPYAHDLMRVIMLKAPEQILQHAYYVSQLLDAAGWFMHAAVKDPHGTFKSFYAYGGRDDAALLATAAARQAPALALTTIQQVEDILHNGGHEQDFAASVWKFRDLVLAAALTQDLVVAAAQQPIEMQATEALWRDRVDASAIRAAAADPENLRREAAATPGIVIRHYAILSRGKNVADLVRLAVVNAEAQGKTGPLYDGIQKLLNERHEMPDRARFAIVDNDVFDAGRLYDLLLAPARSDIYTSTFNGLVNRLLQRMKTAGLTLADLAGDPARRAGEAEFLEMAGTYGRADELLAPLPEAARAELLIGTLKAAEASEQATDMAAVADLLQGVHQPELLRTVEGAMLADFARAQKKGARERLGLLISSYDRTHADTENYPDDIARVVSDPYLALPDNTRLAANQLYDHAGRSIELVTFNKYYLGKPEPDGDATFNDMLRDYRRSPSRWRIEDEGFYVHIVSRGGLKAVHIFANKPEYDGSELHENGVADIKRAWDKMIPAVEPDKILFIMRGHSYQLEKVLPYLNEKTPFVFVGACGSKKEIEEILRAAPHTQFLGTQGTGTMEVNRPLLLHFSEALRDGKTIVWNDFWRDVVMPLHDPRKNDYMNPANNTALGFLQAYITLSRRGPGTVDSPLPALPPPVLKSPD